MVMSAEYEWWRNEEMVFQSFLLLLTS